MNKTTGHFASCRQTGKAKNRFLVAAFAVDISQNTPPFSSIMTLARDMVSMVLG
jgi:hypothetical protein